MAKLPTAKFDINDGTDEPDLEPVSPVTKLPPPPAPPQMVTLTPEQFQQLLTMAQGQTAPSTGDLASAITAGMQSVREPIPENKQDPGISYQNPLGERAHPRPALKCEMWYGVIDDRERENIKVTRVRPIEATELTIWELLALNMLEPTDTHIKRLDGESMRVIVQPTQNSATGAMDRLILAYEMRLIGKKSSENKNTIPDLTSVVYQLTKHDLRPDTLPYPEKKDELAWLLKEHRAKHYVSTREKVAA